jgi:signal transduction histidine kinase
VATLGERNSGRQDRSFIEEFGRGLDSAIIELANATRTRAAGYVTRNGLVSALRSVRRDSPIDVRINGDVRRHPPRSELCVYYCCLEAIQNAIKHAGPGASVSVRLFETGEGIGFEVADDGVGFDPGAVAEGSGLHNIRERVASVGGTVEVSSVPGRGTRITGTIPDRMNE